MYNIHIYIYIIPTNPLGLTKYNQLKADIGRTHLGCRLQKGPGFRPLGGESPPETPEFSPVGEIHGDFLRPIERWAERLCRRDLCGDRRSQGLGEIWLRLKHVFVVTQFYATCTDHRYHAILCIDKGTCLMPSDRDLLVIWHLRSFSKLYTCIAQSLR